MAFDINTAVFKEDYSKTDSNTKFDLSTAVFEDEIEQNQTDNNIQKLEPLTKRNPIQDAFYWITKTGPSAYKSGYNDVNIADLEMKGIYNGKGLNTAQLNKLEKLQNKSFGRYNPENNYGIIEDYKQKDPFTITGVIERTPNFIKKAYADTAKNLPIIIEATKAGGIGAGIGAILGGAGGGIATKNPTGAITGAKTGAIWGGRVNSARRIFEIEAGLTKNELRTINEEIIAEGNEPLSEQELNLYSIAVGGANASLEIVGLEKVLETMPAGKQILDNLKDKQLKNLVKNQEVRAQILDVLKRYGNSIFTEAGTEGLQEVTNIIAAEKVRQLGGLESTPLTENVKRVVESVSAGAGVALFLGGAGSTMQTALILRKKGMSPNKAQQQAESMTMDERLQFVDENATTLIQAVYETADIKEQQAIENLKENYFNQLKEAGVDDIEANQTASLYALGFAKLAKDSGKSINEIAETNISFKNLSEDEAVKQYNQGFNQVPQDVEPKFQADNIDAEKNIQDNFGSSSEELQEMFKADVLNILQENMVDESEFSFEDIGLYGSYTKGKNKATSDIDVLVQYSGSMKEDAAFNMLNEQGLTITDVNGNEVKVDINPINVETSGTIDEHIAQMNQYEKEDNTNIYYQAMIKDIDKNQKVDIIDLSTKFIKNQNLTKKDLSSYIKTLIGTAPLKSSDKKALFEFVKKSKRVGKKDVYVPDHIAGSSKVETKYKKERNTFVKNITNLIQKSVFIDIDKNDDKNTKPNIDNYLRFYVPVRINNDIFTVRITAENNESKNLFNILNADVYDVIIDKKIQASSPSTMGNLMKPVSNNIITQSQQTSSVEKITIEEMLKGVKDPDGKLYFQSAWHGGAVNFDKFDLGYALSGEGAMVHGYGVYLAQNRDVSEGYRKKLAINKEVIYYDGKQIAFNNQPIYGELLKEGKEKVLKRIQNELLILEQELIENEQNTLDDTVDYLEQKIFKKEAELSFVKSIDVNKLEIKKEEGQLYEVDIPEDDVLLDEDLTFNEQSEFVNNALRDLLQDEKFNEYVQEEQTIEEFAETEITDWEYGFSGGQIYNRISNLLGSDEQASKLLNEYGIKGITYDGYQDGRCYVIFDDKAVDIIKKYYQGLDEDSNVSDTEYSIRNSKGFFYEKKAFDGTPKENIVVLIKNKADASTLVHEFAHIYLQTLNNLARTSDKAKQQLLTVNKWLRYDGKEYTTAQHEKFADGFVAYVKSGKAPSYGLKRVFENFRRWLSDIYNNIVTNENIELDNETKKVFDELLGDLSVNQQIKLSEEIIQKAKDNAALRMRDELVEKGKIKFNELTDKQRRYRDTAYDIIYYALKHSKNEETRNYVQNISDLRMKLGSGNTKSLQRQFERIELLLAETEDAFSANDGFLQEWGEFFNDTGVSYDNQELGADAELALNAFEVIRDKKYLYDETFEELSENDVKKAQYELDYIINEYKYAEDKSIPMVAFFDWIDSQHPYIQDELLKQWENETNEIDRYQAMSKFEQAKEDLKLKAMQMQGLGDYSMQFAEYARAIVKRLDFMTETDKARIFDKLKDFNSFKEVLANLDGVMDFAQTLYNVTERRKIADDIIKEVKGTIHEWKDGIKRTKYTYPANNLFTRLRELNKLPLEDIKDLYDAQVNEEIKPTYEADTVNTDDYYETIEKMFIEFKANGVYYNSTEFLQDLLTRIQNAKFTAKIARDEMDFERRMQAINLVDEAAKAVDKHKGKVSKLEQAYRYGFNLNSALEMMFDKNIKSKFSLDYLYAQKDAKVGADRDAVLEKLKKNFGFKGPIADTLLFNKFIDMTKKGEFKITQRYSPDIAQGVIRETHRDKETGKVFTDKKINYAKDLARSEWEPEEIELSRMEVLYYYIQSLNEESYKILTDMGDETTPPKGQFDKYEFDEMINQLTDQERMMGLILQQAAEKYYDELNRYHIKKYHTELGKVSMYFPRKTELTEVKPLELFSDYVNYSGVLSAQKQRTANAGARIAPANALAVLFQHMEKANTLIVMGEQLDLMNRVFKDQSLKKKVEIVWGIDTANEFYNQIAGNLYSGQQSMLSSAEDVMARVSNNVVKAQIFAKAQVGLKQIISFMNYGTGDEHVSTAEWNATFLKQSFTPQEWKKNIDYMMNIPYLKDRFGRGGSTDALKRQLEQRIFAKMSLLDDFFSLPIKIGDMGAIILGGKPYIDALINKGYTEEQAQKIFIEKTVNEMQSSIPSTLSNLQRNAAKQPFAKMFFAYQNTPWQYFRVASNAIIRWKQNPNKDTTLNMVKLVGLYMFIFPLIFNLASSLSLVTGDEDELKSDIWKSVIGGVTFVPIAGMFINAMLSGVLGERVSTGNWFDKAATMTGNTARKIAKGDDVTAVDVLKALALFGEAGTGLPLTTLGTEVAGVGDIATGSPAKGIMKVAGYSDYRAKKISGEVD